MTIVGRVSAIWRYPVKSMQGESVNSCFVSHLGVLGDRGWALKDEIVGEIRGAKKFPILMQCRASYKTEPEGDLIPSVEIICPDGRCTTSEAPDINSILSDVVGKPVTIWPRRPPEDLDHYRRSARLTEFELRDIFGRDPDEPLPDLKTIPEDILKEITEYTSPRGTYFDAFPIHILTTGWLAELSNYGSNSRFEAARFRPNILIETQEIGFVELKWCGRRLHVGEAEFACTMPTMRCSMAIQATGTLPKDPRVLRTIVRESDQNVGAYASVVRTGEIRVGDSVDLF